MVSTIPVRKGSTLRKDQKDLVFDKNNKKEYVRSKFLGMAGSSISNDRQRPRLPVEDCKCSIVFERCRRYDSSLTW
ncbi:hypothetical protein MTO96_012490 [Rhipicephalus appendiculatus]